MKPEKLEVECNVCGRTNFGLDWLDIKPGQPCRHDYGDDGVCRGIYKAINKSEDRNMTRKDYIAIAACIKAERDTISDRSLYDDQTRIVYSIMNRIAVELAMDNPHFDRDKFIKACGF